MEGDGVRYMHFETPWIQGAMRVEAPDEIELDYVQRMMVWMLFRDEAEVTRGHARAARPRRRHAHALLPQAAEDAHHRGRAQPAA